MSRLLLIPGGKPEVAATASAPIKALCDTLANAAKPHRIPVTRGAVPEDVAHTARQVGLIFDLALSALQGQLENLRENLPIGREDFSDIYGGMRDLRSEVIGRLQNLEDGR